ncbi:MAG: type II secretion system protein [Planctomycetes bacterium]|nr:type II secretion system protein [Planctomycetota bacterium]
MNRQQGSIARAFTLVEVLIVVIILGILAAVVVPQFSNASQEATGASLKSTLDVIKDRVDYEKHQSPTSQYPTVISPTWFASQIGPLHPGNSFGVANVEVDTTAGRMHPVNKVLVAGVAGAYWYNSTEGIIRARVKDQGTSASTLTFYNDVNDSNETTLGNYTGGAS